MEGDPVLQSFPVRMLLRRRQHNDPYGEEKSAGIIEGRNADDDRDEDDSKETSVDSTQQEISPEMSVSEGSESDDEFAFVDDDAISSMSLIELRRVAHHLESMEEQQRRDALKSSISLANARTQANVKARQQMADQQSNKKISRHSQMIKRLFEDNIECTPSFSYKDLQ